ncbi:Probable polygalacturonase At1g80170 [Linum perenne]
MNKDGVDLWERSYDERGLRRPGVGESGTADKLLALESTNQPHSSKSSEFLMKTPEISCCCWATSALIVLLSIELLISPKVVCAEGFESGLELPQSGSVVRRFRSKRVLHIHDFGAAGDGVQNDTQALGDAWEIACSSPKRSRIVVPAGTYLVHPIVMSGPCKSKITFSIFGTIVAPQDPQAWRGMNHRRWLYFAKALTFHRCKDLKVENLRVFDSQQMHVAFTNCVRVFASLLQVLAPAFSPNTDGIHISSSKGVQVMNTIVRTGDDCISIVGNSSRINIKNVVCGPGHGISIGSLGKSNSTDFVESVSVDGAFLSNTKNGLRIKTWQGGSGKASDINFQNVHMRNVSNPIIIDQFYCDSKLPCANQTKAVKVQDVSFKHIKGTSATREAIRISCSECSPCEGLYLEDVQLSLSTEGGVTESFCWEAYGTSEGSVFPPPCFSSDEQFIRQIIPYQRISLFNLRR